MAEKIAENFYRIEIPLPGNPLKSINSYVITGGERNLMVDTGMNRKACIEAMEAGLSEIGVDLEKTDFFITHLHADHFGLIGRLATERSTIYFNKPDAARIKLVDGWDSMLEYARVSGFPEGILEVALHNHPGRKYWSNQDFELTLLDDGDTIEVGDYAFTCVQTPGHTPGHMCLYEPAKKFFLSGDHILIDITPNIQLWSDDDNPLEQYMTSLDRVTELDIELVLPGHRRLWKDCNARIRELKEHHRHRADEVLSILEKGSRTAYEIAGGMTWDIDCASWEEFPIMQQWFATGEAIAHVKYLADRGEVRIDTRDGKIVAALP
jgi:glyoxylase-like metal-dependent hydrolase (beta-lactamase superfamily II)